MYDQPKCTRAYLGWREGLINHISDRLSRHTRELIQVETTLCGQEFFVDLLRHLLGDVSVNRAHILSGVLPISSQMCTGMRTQA